METLTKYEDFRASLLTLLEQHGLNQNAVRDTIATYPNTFSLNDEIVELRPKIIICGTHISADFCYAWESCDELHVCPRFVLGDCMDDSCSLGHCWTTDHNRKILQSFNMDKLPSKTLCKLIRCTFSELSPVKSLDVCQSYNKGKCGRRLCSSLHICLNFVIRGGNCGLPSCLLNHYTTEPSVCKLLESHGLPSNGCPKDIIAAVLAQNQSLANQACSQRHVRRLSTSSSLSALSPNPQRGTSTSVWSHFYKGDVPVPEICYSSVEGKCQFEAEGCTRLHAKEHFHWQVSEISDQWFNLQNSQVISLERAYCDPAQESVTIPRLDTALVTPTNPLLSLLGRDLWSADLITLTLKDSSRDKILNLRRLSTEKTEDDVPASVFLWYYFFDGSWVEYGRPNPAAKDDLTYDVSCESIEQTFNTPAHQEMSLGKKEKIDFQSMFHVKGSSHKWPVRRRPKRHLEEAEASGDHDQILPSSWEAMDPDERLRIVDLPPWHTEHEQVLQLLHTSLQDVKVLKVERVQNPFIWRAMQNKIEELSVWYGDVDKVDIRTLFHGTDVEVIKHICTENFDWRLHGSRFGQKYGHGAYFATEADKALEYCTYDLLNQRYLLVAQVVVGTAVQGDSTMHCPPQNPATSIPYNSTVDDEFDPTIIVKYDKQEYYPQYIITLG